MKQGNLFGKNARMAVIAMTDIPTFDITRIPFRYLRPLLHALRIGTLTALTAVRPLPLELSARVVETNRLTQATKNHMTRERMMVHVIAWYRLLKEVGAALPESELKTNVMKLVDDNQWIGFLGNEVEKAQTVENR